MYTYIYIYIYDAGLLHPPSPAPWYPPPCLSSGQSSCWALLLSPSSWVVLLGLVPSSPLWDRACGLFGWPRPACGGLYVQVWLQPLAVMSSLRGARYPTRRFIVALLTYKWRLSLLFRSAKKHWLASFSIVLPPSGLRGFVPFVRDRFEGDTIGGEGGCRGPGTESIYTYIYIYIYIYLYIQFRGCVAELMAP